MLQRPTETREPPVGGRRRHRHAGVAADHAWRRARRHRGDPVRAEEFLHLPDHARDHLCDRDPRPQPVDRFQRPVLARPRRVLRDRRLHGGDHDGEHRHQLRLDDPGRGDRLLRVRLPVRPAGAAARRHLSGARHLRARDRDPAGAEILRARALDRRRAGYRDHQAGCAVRPAAQFRPVALFVHRRWSRS